MKPLAIGLGIGIVGMGVIAAGLIPSMTEVIQKEVIVEVTPDWAEDADAVEAAQDVIQRKEWEIELEGVQGEIEALRVREEQLEKDLDIHWKSTSNIKAHIRSVFHEDPHTALAVANCESGLNPDAYNDKNYNDSVDSGIFQINSVHHTRMNQLGLDVWDVEDNVAFARMLYDESGWEPWVCYTKGMLAMN